jgi:hypothetical protein
MKMVHISQVRKHRQLNNRVQRHHSNNEANQVNNNRGVMTGEEDHRREAIDLLEKFPMAEMCLKARMDRRSLISIKVSKDNNNNNKEKAKIEIQTIMKKEITTGTMTEDTTTTEDMVDTEVMDDIETIREIGNIVHTLTTDIEVSQETETTEDIEEDTTEVIAHDTAGNQEAQVMAMVMGTIIMTDGQDTQKGETAEKEMQKDEASSTNRQRTRLWLDAQTADKCTK